MTGLLQKKKYQSVKATVSVFLELLLFFDWIELPFVKESNSVQSQLVTKCEIPLLHQDKVQGKCFGKKKKFKASDSLGLGAKNSDQTVIQITCNFVAVAKSCLHSSRAAFSCLAITESSEAKDALSST
jgi:hypothetical protein